MARSIKLRLILRTMFLSLVIPSSSMIFASYFVFYWVVSTSAVLSPPWETSSTIWMKKLKSFYWGGLLAVWEVSTVQGSWCPASWWSSARIIKSSNWNHTLNCHQSLIWLKWILKGTQAKNRKNYTKYPCIFDIAKLI